MIIATFREGTLAAGQTIEHDESGFRLTGGPCLNAQQVREYDAEGQLEWASETLRRSALDPTSPPPSDPSAGRAEKSVGDRIFGGVVIATIVLAIITPIMWFIALGYAVLTH